MVLFLPSSSPPSALRPVRRRVGQARGGRQHLLLGFLHQLQVARLPKRLKMRGSMGLCHRRARAHASAGRNPVVLQTDARECLLILQTDQEK
jgi:hypothetical protein